MTKITFFFLGVFTTLLSVIFYAKLTNQYLVPEYAIKMEVLKK